MKNSQSLTDRGFCGCSTTWLHAVIVHPRGANQIRLVIQGDGRPLHSPQTHLIVPKPTCASLLCLQMWQRQAQTIATKTNIPPIRHFEEDFPWSYKNTSKEILKTSKLLIQEFRNLVVAHMRLVWSAGLSLEPKDQGATGSWVINSIKKPTMSSQ